MTKSEYKVQEALGLLPISAYECNLIHGISVIGTTIVLAVSRKTAIKEATRLLGLKHVEYKIFLATKSGSFRWQIKRKGKR